MEVVGKNMTEGAQVDVFITDLLGRPIEGANVYTESMSVYTDESGRAKVRIPYSGIIYANAFGETMGKYLNITRLAFIKTKSSAYILEEVEGNIIDSKNRPIGVVKIFYENKTISTDQNSVFKIRFETKGVKEIYGEKHGYLIKSATIEITSPAEVCYFPYALNLLGLKEEEAIILWVLTAVLSALTWLMYRRRTLSGFLRSFLYSFAPLLLSIPAVWPFTICFMANVAVLQLLFEAALLFIKKENKEKGKKK